jgi:cardiolipin synthase
MPSSSTPAGPARPATGSDRWATIPNLVTLIRFLLLAPACWVIIDEGSWVPPVLVGVWALTDWIDGFLARLLDQATRLGEIIDPIADRIGIMLVAISLGIDGALNWVPVAIIVVVDVLVAAIVGPAARQGRTRVTLFGKARTAVMFIGICALVLGISVWPQSLLVGRVLVWAGCAMHIWAGVTYLRAALLGTGPAVARRAPHAEVPADVAPEGSADLGPEGSGGEPTVDHARGPRGE